MLKYYLSREGTRLQRIVLLFNNTGNGFNRKTIANVTNANETNANVKKPNEYLPYAINHENNNFLGVIQWTANTHKSAWPLMVSKKPTKKSTKILWSIGHLNRYDVDE